MKVSIGIVERVVGPVVAIDENGNRRIIKSGDKIFEGEEIKLLDKTAKVDVRLNNGKEITVEEENQSILEEAVATNDSGLSEIQKNILAGKSLGDLEETAAGGGSGGNGEGGASLGSTKFTQSGQNTGAVVESGFKNIPDLQKDTAALNQISTGSGDLSETRISEPIRIPELISIDGKDASSSTNDETPDIIVRVQVGATPALVGADNSEIAATKILNRDGTWTLTPVDSVKDIPNLAVVAKIGDRSSDRLEISPNIDVDAPTVTVAEVTVVDTDVRADGKADKVTVKGSSDEANAPFTIKDKDGNIIKEGVTDNDGKFEVAIDTDTVQSGDKVTVEVIDKAGNIRSVHKYANNLIYEDKTAPVVTIQEIKSIDTDSTADGRADETRVKFTVDDPTATLDVKGPNFQTPSQIIDNLDGSKTAIFNEGFAKGDEITITATDKAGNKGQDSKKVSDISFEDTTPPTVQISELTLQDIDNDDTPNRADNKAEFISIKGNSDAKNTTFEIYHNGNKIGEGTTNNKGEFQARIPNTNKAVELNDEITVKIKDKAGNVGEATKTANKITHENLVVEIVEDKYDANGNLSINGVERGDNYLNKSELGNKNTVSARITLPEGMKNGEYIHMNIGYENNSGEKVQAQLVLEQKTSTEFEVVRGEQFLPKGSKVAVENGTIAINNIPTTDGKLLKIDAAHQSEGQIKSQGFDAATVDKTAASIGNISAEFDGQKTIVKFDVDDVGGSSKDTVASVIIGDKVVKAVQDSASGSKVTYKAEVEGDLSADKIQVDVTDRAGNMSQATNPSIVINSFMPIDLNGEGYITSNEDRAIVSGYTDLKNAKIGIYKDNVLIKEIYSDSNGKFETKLSGDSIKANAVKEGDAITVKVKDSSGNEASATANASAEVRLGVEFYEDTGMSNSTKRQGNDRLSVQEDKLDGVNNKTGIDISLPKALKDGDILSVKLIAPSGVNNDKFNDNNPVYDEAVLVYSQKAGGFVAQTDKSAIINSREIYTPQKTPSGNILRLSEIDVIKGKSLKVAVEFERDGIKTGTVEDQIKPDNGVGVNLTPARSDRVQVEFTKDVYDRAGKLEKTAQGKFGDGYINSAEAYIDGKSNTASAKIVLPANIKNGEYITVHKIIIGEDGQEKTEFQGTLKYSGRYDGSGTLQFVEINQKPSSDSFLKPGSRFPVGKDGSATIEGIPLKEGEETTINVLHTNGKQAFSQGKDLAILDTKSATITGTEIYKGENGQTVVKFYVDDAVSKNATDQVKKIVAEQVRAKVTVGDTPVLAQRETDSDGNAVFVAEFDGAPITSKVHIEAIDRAGNVSEWTSADLNFEVTSVNRNWTDPSKGDKWASVLIEANTGIPNARYAIYPDDDPNSHAMYEGVTDNNGKISYYLDYTPSRNAKAGSEIYIEVIDANNNRMPGKTKVKDFAAVNVDFSEDTTILPNDTPAPFSREFKRGDGIINKFEDGLGGATLGKTDISITISKGLKDGDILNINLNSKANPNDNATLKYVEAQKAFIVQKDNSVMVESGKVYGITELSGGNKFLKLSNIDLVDGDKLNVSVTLERNGAVLSQSTDKVDLVDTTPPTVQISELTLQDIDNDDTPNRADNKAEFISIKGNSDAKNTTFEIYHNGNKIGEGTTNNKGEFQARIPNTNKAVELNDEITVKIKDKAGNVGEATKTANKITHENLVVEIVEDKYDANGNLSINGVERGDNYLNKSELGNKNTVSARITLPENTEINDGIHLALRVANLDNSSPSAINMGLRQISDTRFEVVRGSSFLKTGTKLTVEDGAITIDKIPVPADGKIMQVVAAYQKNGGSIQPLSYDEVVVDKTAAELTVIAAETISDERGNTSTIVTFTLDDGNKKLTELSSVGKVSLTGGSEEAEVKAFGITSDGKYVYRASFDGDITGKNIEINAADRAGNVARIHVDVDSKLLSTQKDVGSDMFGDDNAQTINGTDKNEFIDGKGGRDTINAGSGDDTVAFDANDESINGGDGADTLLITDTIDLTKIQTDIVGFEKIVLQNEDKNLKLAIDGLKVRDMLDVKENGQDNILEIIGKNGDVLGLKGFAEITDAKEIAGDSNRFEAEISSKMGEYKFYKTTVDESTFYVQVSRHIEVKQDENIF